MKWVNNKQVELWSVLAITTAAIVFCVLIFVAEEYYYYYVFVGLLFFMVQPEIFCFAKKLLQTKMNNNIKNVAPKLAKFMLPSKILKKGCMLIKSSLCMR